MNLTTKQIITQSAAIHPEWNATDHYNYLRNDAFVEDVSLQQVQLVMRQLDLRGGA